MATVEETRRAAFEKFCVSEAGGYLPEHLRRDADGEYAIVWEYWHLWNAALNSVCIVLPALKNSHLGGPASEMGPSYEQVEDGGFDYGVEQCRAAIEATGLGLTVK